MAGARHIITLSILISTGCAGPQLTVTEWIQRGSEFEEKGRYHDALDAYTSALEKNPRDANIYMYRGLVYTMTGKWKRGIADLTSALKLNPESALLYSVRGLMRFDSGDYANAIKDAEQAARLDPASYQAFRRNMEIEILKIKSRQ